VTTTALARDALRRCVLFSRLDDAGLDACADQLRPRRFRRDETVFHQGDPGDALHVVVAGAVKIVLPSPAGGEPAIIAILRPGDFFGELALLDGEPHSATAIALEATETLMLRRDAFDHLLDSSPQVRGALLGSLALELRRLTGHVETLHFLGLPARLARRIVDLAEQVNPAAGMTGTVQLAWPYTQAELAGMIGASRESVNRLMADFSTRGLIRLEHDVLSVPDLARLRGEAER
jgi:CRP/FNR family transcriptional regulator, cyclic AMP receptor protein